jgi:hypothetical protein
MNVLQRTRLRRKALAVVNYPRMFKRLPRGVRPAMTWPRSKAQKTSCGVMGGIHSRQALAYRLTPTAAAPATVRS